jgi:hypothetical protein
VEECKLITICGSNLQTVKVF